MRHYRTMNVDIYALRAADDAPRAVQRLDAVCFEGGERTDINVELERPFTRAWAAHIPAFGGEAGWVGYILTWLVADELHILNVATDPKHRRRGIGRALVDHALRFARENSVHLILLEVRRSNRQAIGLYRSFGFSVSGLRTAYYSNNGEDALEMVLVLDPETGDIVASRDEVRLEEV